MEEDGPDIKNLTVVGTSHISPDSLRAVRKTVLDVRPEFVAIELDKKRLFALTQKSKKGPNLGDIRRLGVKGWVFAKFGGWVERSLGRKVGVMPGDEMLQGIAAAAEVGAKLALIDRDIDITLKRFSAHLTWGEKWNFVVDVFKGFFGRGLVKFDISKVPSQQIISDLLKEVRKRYPNVYEVLIEERNEVMARNLSVIMRKHPEAKIVAVVGAGHEREIPVLLKKYLNA